MTKSRQASCGLCLQSNGHEETKNKYCFSLDSLFYRIFMTKHCKQFSAFVSIFIKAVPPKFPKIKKKMLYLVIVSHFRKITTILSFNYLVSKYGIDNGNLFFKATGKSHLVGLKTIGFLLIKLNFENILDKL